MRGQALRYIGWQIWDRAGPRLLVSLTIVAAVCLPLHFAMKDRPPPPEQLTAVMRALYQQFAGIAVVVFFHGIVSEDRTKGYFRFYLAKPASPLWLYGQAFVLSVLGVLAFSAGFLAIFSLAVRPVWEWPLMLNGLALALLLGGLIFCFSPLTRHDWLWMLIAIVASTVLRGRFPAAQSTFGRVLEAALPPNQLLFESLTARQWAWLGGWGLGLFIIGLLILRWRPLGED
jgi:hypothetical protein